jgi:hypothetical protein
VIIRGRGRGYRGPRVFVKKGLPAHQTAAGSLLKKVIDTVAVATDTNGKKRKLLLE